MPATTNTTNNQWIIEAVPGISVSVVDARFGGRTTTLAESAIIIQRPNGYEDIVGIQYHGRDAGRPDRRRSNRAIACQIARSIRAREARKAAI